MTKIFNFALKIKGVVGRVADAKSSEPATPPNLERAPGGCLTPPQSRCSYSILHLKLFNIFTKNITKCSRLFCCR